MLIAQHNLNETPEHYELKQIAKYLLWSRHCSLIATEVSGFYSPDITTSRSWLQKNIIDAVGVDFKGLKNKTPKVKIIGMEAKASLADFRNGFCLACEYTYIIAPKGIIPPEELPEGIGLIEADLAAYKLGYWNGVWYTGIDNTVVAKPRLSNRFADQAAYQTWAMQQIPRISYRASVENLYKKPEILINKDVKTSRR